ncbi:MAG: ester cyclase [Acidimicrobiia bacterium]|nr:ester cyclase [Acidimicrobiia bacterium]
MADPAALMEKAFAALTAKDLDALQALQHDTLVEDFIVLGPVTGRDTIRAFFDELLVAFPDMEFKGERIMGVDDRIAVGQWSLAGTFTGGPFQGIQPTGKHVSLRGLDVMEFEGDLMVYNTIYYDGLSFARQIGLLPPEGSRRDKAITSGFNALTKAKSKLSRS